MAVPRNASWPHRAPLALGCHCGSHRDHYWRLTAASAPGAAASGTAKAATPATPGTVSCGPPGYFIQCYSPGQYQVAYGVAPLLKRGITGKGETVVMPELANRPGPNFTDIRKDLAAFDRRFGLPAAKLKVTTTIAGASAPYVAGTEEVEDTESCTRSRPVPPSTLSSFQPMPRRARRTLPRP